MKKSLIILLLTAIVTGNSLSKEIDKDCASQVAKNFLQMVAGNSGETNLELVHVYKSKYIQQVNPLIPTEFPLIYIFNIKNENGFIIVSADDRIQPVLGYSKEGSFIDSNLPPNFRKWIEGYKSQIKEVILFDLEPGEKTNTSWKLLLDNQPLPKNKFPVNPLISTKWDQSPYYNELCPYDYSYNQLTVTGCVATAMAQIMKYWNYPANGTGFHSYNHPVYGTLSANFASTTYNWGSMPINVTSSNNAVATLMYHCGVSVEMNYGVAQNGGSSTNSLAPVANALIDYFQYSSSVQFVQRESYTDSQWINLLKSELDAGRPIEYGGIGSGGGHAFVCDGYDAYDYFHMNWGWSGYYDGYFLIDYLNPGGTGTGGGSGGYNSYQQAVIGIQSPSGGSTIYDMTLYEGVAVTPNPIYFTQGFSVHTDIANWGTNTFNGDFCAAIFDDSGYFIEYVQILSGYSLGGGMHYTYGLDFTNSGLVSLLPGSYYIGVFYRPVNGDWILVENGNYQNLISFSVYYSNDIELYQQMNISCGSNITRNQPFTVTLDIANFGTSVFEGDFALNIYNLEGYYEETIQILTGAYLEPNFYFDDVVFESGGISVSPGTYLLALLHKRNGQDWELSGSSYWSNPAYINVKEEALLADIYEDNNSQNNPFDLPVNFAGNTTVIQTTGSNLHLGSDIDFYEIELNPGFEYTISARAHDSYSSGNGQTYSCDVAWSFSNGIDWSDLYDDIMPGNIILSNGGTLLFKVAPYFVGETGTYLFEISISRSETGIEDQLFPSQIDIYPNPAMDVLHIAFNTNHLPEKVALYNISGSLCAEWGKDKIKNSVFLVPVANLIDGVYVILIQDKDKVYKYKFVKTNW